MIHYDRCPVCGSTAVSSCLTARDYTVSGETFEIWECADCSLRFTQDIPGPDDIGRYYQSEDYISHTETSKGVVNAMYLQVRKFTLALKKKLVAAATGARTGALLDIGAGTGAFVHYMQEAGWQAQGVEPDEMAIKRAAAVYGLQLKPSSALFDYDENSFDAITMWHVLEHVHDLHGYVRQLKKICRPGGRIFIAVPNYTSQDARRYGACWAAYDVPRHLYHFSPASMARLTQINGLEIEQIHPLWFDSFYVSLLSEKYKTGSTRLLSGFRAGLHSNRHALNDKRSASSLIYVLKISR